jgi:hypothetical protein
VYCKWNNEPSDFTDRRPGQGEFEPSALVDGKAGLRGGLRTLRVAVIYRV